MIPRNSASVSRGATPANVASDEQESNREQDESERSWADRGYTFIKDKYLKTRMASCGDSYFLLMGKTGLYETKNEPMIEIFGEQLSKAKQLSEADRLNGKKTASPERWSAQWKLKIEPPYRYYRVDHWDAWSNHNTSMPFSVEFGDDGKWNAWNNQGREYEFQPIGKFKCHGSNIAVESIPGL